MSEMQAWAMGVAKHPKKPVIRPKKNKKLRTATQIIQSAKLAVRSPRVLIKSRKKKRNDENANTHSLDLRVIHVCNASQSKLETFKYNSI